MTIPDLLDDAAEDASLVARWQAGDERAATQLVERHATALARFASSLGVRDGIDELVQDTFVRAFGALDGFRSESTLRTWLFTIERRLVLDRRRADRRAAPAVEVNEQDAYTEFDALDGMVATETEVQLRLAIGRLTRLQREVFLLRVQEGRSYKEIAEIVGSTEGATRVHYHNAMKAVKESLHAEG
jgi:RNA polymerase sigma-70 factor, ECF subfamily